MMTSPSSSWTGYMTAEQQSLDMSPNSARSISNGKLSNSVENKIFLVIAFVLVTYFLWMDVALYYHLQTVPLPIIGHHMGSPPFNEITIKLLMLDQSNHYIHLPLSELFNSATKFSSIAIITPNIISFSHIFVSFVAAKFLSSASLLFRRVGILCFEFRNFLDALDGVIYRVQAKKNHTSSPGSIGYIIDGVSDFIGGTFLLISCFLYLQRGGLRKNSDVNWIKNGENNQNAGSWRKILFVLSCLALLITLSCFFWDRYIYKYQLLLESPAKSASQQLLQNEVLRSSTMWIIIWFWKIFNAHAILEMVLLSIFVDKLWDFLTWIQYIGFVMLGSLVFITEVYLHTTEQYIGELPPLKING